MVEVMEATLESQVKIAGELERCRQELETSRQVLGSYSACFDTVMDHLSMGMAMFDSQSRLILANNKLRDLLKLRQEEHLPGLTIADLSELFVQRLGALASGHSRIESIAALAKSSSKRSLNLIFATGQVLKITHSLVSTGGFVHTFEDVTERRRAEATASHLASHDVLTGLPNRRLLKQHIQVSLSDAKAKCAVLCVDLDRFKSVNDTLGHAGGDALLVEVSKRLRHCVPAGDTVGRLGGNEFVILHSEVSSEDDIAQMAQRVVAAISRPFDILGQSVLVGASVGVAVSPRDGDSADRLIKSADMALFEAKRAGRGHFYFFDPSLEARARERQALESDLRVAVAQGQFELHYQPYFAARQRKLVGFEALLRWNHPVRGRISPVDFIPIAEELGLITELGDWILKEACKTAATWPKDLMISVNVSTRQFINHDLIGAVEHALSSSGLPAKRLEVEITESALMENVDEVSSTLERLRGQGIGLAMDDFGTGYSSLAYLRRFNFSKVKIDRSFINGLETDSQSIAIVRAIIALCGNLNIEVTAEGVETELQADILRLENCDYLQGFLLGRPTARTKLEDVFFTKPPSEKALPLPSQPSPHLQ